ncbi:MULTISPECIES: hypothetical protein [unclassified Haladaptatus]|uniref:hypothetical protein n=1 Tax=unclassified Haladaptatus TaxID=2622732 RepID=UPI00209BE605|nr:MULTISPECIES: hypothetical protein [unclassified Haladaptatus]MCO8244157.1 hypothetical protein [Haladaptatus sp. AB643]MCO8255962.1 hypothetical protein [Haladaptatus sp. AB618]
MPDTFPTVRVGETELKAGRTPAPDDEFEFQLDDSLADDYFVDETNPAIMIQWKFELVVEA